MRSFGGVNVLWTSLTRALTGLPPDGMPQLLSGEEERASERMCGM